MVLGIRSSTPFEKRLGHRFRHVDLLEVALTHRSWVNEKGTGENYERMEFLGDSVLGLVAAEWLYESHPDLPEGELSRLKSYLVSAHVLERFAQQIDLGSALRVGVGEDRSGGRAKRSLLADSMEAVIGAVYLDGGLKPARELVLEILNGAAADKPKEAFGDAKTTLQELAQARGWDLPEYRLVGETGPDHRKVFEIECWLCGELAGSGEGEAKKAAEQRAAAMAVDWLRTREAAATAEKR
jgi:ribonuclease-3